MKNPFYVLETYGAKSGWDYPEWNKVATLTTLKAARAKKAHMLANPEMFRDGTILHKWLAHEIRIVEHTKKVIH